MKNINIPGLKFESETVTLRLASQVDEPPLISVASCKCEICRDKDSIYTCPRCDIRYCSLACFKGPKHQDCSESFYKKLIKDQQQQELKPDAADKLRVYEMLESVDAIREPSLKQNVEQEDFDDDEKESLDLDGIDLDDVENLYGAVWNRLSPKHRDSFLKVLDSREKQRSLISQLEIWKPWWIRAPKIQCLDEEGDNDDDDLKPRRKEAVVLDGDAPKLITPLSVHLLKAFEQSPPDGSLLLCIVEMLFGYAYITRTFNSSFAQLTTADAPDLAEILKSFLQPLFTVSKEKPNLQTILDTCATRVRSNSSSNKSTLKLSNTAWLLKQNAFTSTLFEDVTILLSSWDFTNRAISDIHAALRLAKVGLIRRESFMAEKKLLFYYAFVIWTANNFEQRDRGRHVGKLVGEYRDTLDKQASDFHAQTLQFEARKGKTEVPAFGIVAEK